MDDAFGDPETRQAVLQLAAFAIENADEERPGGWIVRETPRGLRLLTGRLIALDFRKGRLHIAVQGAVSTEEYTALGADPEKEDVEFRSIPGAQLLTIPPRQAPAVLPSLKARFNAFVDSAMAQIRRPVDLSDHCPEAVALIGQAVGRILPQPVAEEEPVEEVGADGASDTTEEGRTPIVRGRAPIFELGNQSLLGLVDEIERDRIALPDLQRPFVWEDTEVRDLLDSLFVGFPVGTLVFWQASGDTDARMVGTGSDPLSVTDCLYLGQLLPLLTHRSVSDVVGRTFLWSKETKGHLNDAVSAIAPVRNDIAHVREVDRERLMRATLAAADIKKAVAG